MGLPYYALLKLNSKQNPECVRPPIFGCHKLLTRHCYQLGRLVYTPLANVSQKLCLSPYTRRKFFLCKTLWPTKDMSGGGSIAPVILQLVARWVVWLFFPSGPQKMSGDFEAVSKIFLMQFPTKFSLLLNP